MNYLHTMIRVKDLDKNLDFFCNKLGLIETKRQDYADAKFTLIFLAAKGDSQKAKETSAPLLELTYNWPTDNVETETYQTGRAFGHLAFEVEDIYLTCKSLMDKGVEINRPPRDGYMAFIKSPEGISIELLQAGESQEIKEPWKSMQNIGTW